MSLGLRNVNIACDWLSWRTPTSQHCVHSFYAGINLSNQFNPGGEKEHTIFYLGSKKEQLGTCPG